MKLKLFEPWAFAVFITTSLGYIFEL